MTCPLLRPHLLRRCVDGVHLACRWCHRVWPIGEAPDVEADAPISNPAETEAA